MVVWGNPDLTTKTNDHGAEHEDGGKQEINIGGLSGLLADDQHVLDAEVLSALDFVVCNDNEVVCHDNKIIHNEV